MATIGLPPPPAAIHFMGIGGIGVSALARLLLQRGYRVSGCDLTPSRLTAELVAAGATIVEGHDPAHLHGVDLVVISAAVRPGNPELEAAGARGLPVLKRAALLGALVAAQPTIAVAGTHGKTTTSALIALLLLAGGLDPTAFVGGEVPGLGVGGTAATVRLGGGRWAVVEADEYDASFLTLSPQIAVLTNVEADHLDFYGDLEGVLRAFRAFLERLAPDGTLIVCADDAAALALSGTAPGRRVTYGLDSQADWSAHEVVLDATGARFTLHAPGGERPVVTTRLSGRHNLRNALAALAAAVEAGVPLASAVAALARLTPPRRRQEVCGQSAAGALVLDDYAHHPTEIQATLAGLRGRYPGCRLRVAFQPHTYSRTRAFLSEIGASFFDADEVAITEIYAARESETLGMSGREVAATVAAQGVPCTFTPTLAATTAWLERDAGRDVLLVTMGAGDIWQAGRPLIARPVNGEVTR